LLVYCSVNLNLNFKVAKQAISNYFSPYSIRGRLLVSDANAIFFGTLNEAQNICLLGATSRTE